MNPTPVRTPAGLVPAEFVQPVAVTEEQRRTLSMAASLLLAYPEEDGVFLDKLDAVETQLDQLPEEIAGEFRSFLAAARQFGERAMAEHYVSTFDQRRRCSLFLSYYSVGDTRQRGAAILAFRQGLAQLGLEEVTDELPDHLCVVLEAVARTEGDAHAAAVEFIAAHRDGVEVLRSALASTGSPYVSLIVAVCMGLPRVDEDTANSYIDLIRSGPPAEMVGINAQLPFPSAQPDLI